MRRCMCWARNRGLCEVERRVCFQLHESGNLLILFPLREKAKIIGADLQRCLLCTSCNGRRKCVRSKLVRSDGVASHHIGRSGMEVLPVEGCPQMIAIDVVVIGRIGCKLHVIQHAGLHLRQG